MCGVAGVFEVDGACGVVANILFAIDLFETGVLQPLLQIALRKTEPVIPVKLPRLFKIVPQQVQNQDLPPHFQD